MSQDQQIYITIAGIKRSGSTWMANAVRIICEEAGLNVWMGEHRPDMIHHPNKQIALDDWPDHDVVINKIHPFIKEVADRSDYVFSSYRDLLEVQQSWQRFDRAGALLKSRADSLIPQWCVWYYQWRPYVDYEMRYNDLLIRKKNVIFYLLNHLGPSIARAENLPPELDDVLKRLEKEVKPPTDKDYDPKTLMFSNHITQEHG